MTRKPPMAGARGKKACTVVKERYREAAQTRVRTLALEGSTVEGIRAEPVGFLVNGLTLGEWFDLVSNVTLEATVSKVSATEAVAAMKENIALRSEIEAMKRILAEAGLVPASEKTPVEDEDWDIEDPFN